MREQFIEIEAYSECNWIAQTNEVRRGEKHYLILKPSQIALITDWRVEEYSCIVLTSGERYYITLDQELELTDFLNPINLKVKEESI